VGKPGPFAAAISILVLLLFAPADGSAAPASPLARARTFERNVRRVRIGASRQRVRRLLGEPRGRDATSWTYRNPPDRPDGPYRWYTFTFARGRVSKIEDGGVACVLRQRSAPPPRAPGLPLSLARRYSQ
jgi:hypothetical protein